MSCTGRYHDNLCPSEPLRRNKRQHQLHSCVTAQLAAASEAAAPHQAHGRQHKHVPAPTGHHHGRRPAKHLPTQPLRLLSRLPVAVPELPGTSVSPTPQCSVLGHASSVPCSSCYHDKRLASKHLAPSHVRWQYLVRIVAKPQLAKVVSTAGPCVALLCHDGREAISTCHRHDRTCLASDASALHGCLVAGFAFHKLIHAVST
mmetsp:Transcript_88471/g.129369  ORF Transcript_88471/g.129369 Transcript_88471/m.129369 type:complete len:203 (+) Transcript_88471:293-901(+)